MTNNSLFFKILSYVVLIMFVIMIIGNLLGLSSSSMSFTRLLDGFANSPVNDLLSNFGSRLSDFKALTDTLVIDYDNSNVAISGLVNVVNYMSKTFFGVINISALFIQMVASVFGFGIYCYSVFLS